MEIKIRDGYTVSIDLAKLSPEMRERHLIHGIRQRIGDAGAGKTADVARKAGDAVVARLVAGEWGAERADNGVGIARALLVKARTKKADPMPADAWKKAIVFEVKDMASAAAFAEKYLGEGFGPKLVKAVAKVQAAKKVDI